MRKNTASNIPKPIAQNMLSKLTEAGLDDKLINKVIESEGNGLAIKVVSMLREPGLEQNNFRIDSTGWEEVLGEEKCLNERYLENPKGDVWEILEGPCKGEQVFTWGAAMRETAKAGKRMPTDEEFSKILKTKSDMPNPVLVGLYSKSCGNCEVMFTDNDYGSFWSSTEDGNNPWSSVKDKNKALCRDLYLETGNVYRGNPDKNCYKSVRCVKD